MSGTSREDRLAKNETLFRDVNERVEEIATAHADPEEVDFLCECVDVECLERLTVTIETYEQVRSDATHFLVKPAHERPDLEDVIDQGPGYLIVRKHPETHDVVRESDPRA